ncbi:hypothetical protein E3N88_41055 [Mikania micrantha]|uniref:Dual specificity protein phosphatase 1 n=1 Tax=Mikania micrantha TaxID=192012 RepID=A0A5N6LRQ9_9ASTR|nr:hypothetical protein E3N88_41055 [Mikania micrantha]
MDHFDDLSKERMAALLRAVHATKDVKDDNVPSQIEEGLYLGSVGAANNKTLLKSLNITHILTVASSLPPAYPNDFTYKVVDVPDKEDVNIAKFFNDCFGFINEAKRTGGVLVHCFVGRSRSVTIVVAYLMKKHRMGSSEALNLVKSKRSVAAPNSGFIGQLQRYEKFFSELQAENVQLKSRVNVLEVTVDELTKKTSLIIPLQDQLSLLQAQVEAQHKTQLEVNQTELASFRIWNKKITNLITSFVKVFKDHEAQLKEFIGRMMDK